MAEKAKTSVDMKTRIGDGQRTIAKRLLDQVKQRLNDESGVSDRQWGKESLKALQEKVDALKKLDNQILHLIEGLDSEDLDLLIEREIEESDRFRGEQVVLRLEEVLNPSMHSSRAITRASSQNENPRPTNPAHSTKAKLPKLKVNRFNGRLQDWQDWQGFFSELYRWK